MALGTIKFAVGDVWSIKDEPAMLVTIGRIETYYGLIAISVSVSGITMPDGSLNRIGHMPIDEEALAQLVDRRVEIGSEPDPLFESGYDQWKAAEGGVFEFTVSKAVAAITSVAAGRPG